MQRPIRSSKRSSTERFANEFQVSKIEIPQKLLRFSTKFLFSDTNDPSKKKLIPVYTPAPKPSKLLLKYISNKSPLELPPQLTSRKFLHTHTSSLPSLKLQPKSKPVRVVRDPNRLYPL